ncbi:MAG TPA: nitroreductase family protein, partial [Rectinemataceae bacterium]|nr:nitroreductase family protein [Rectinemataceae bacterium]
RNRRIAARGLAPYSAHRAFRHFWIAYQDVMIAAQSACTAADSLGLGSCYIGTIVEHLEASSELLGLDERTVPIELLPLGYPVSPPKSRGKFPEGILVHRERYAEPEEAGLYSSYQEREGGWTMSLTPENLERFRDCCESVEGSEFAQRAVADAEARGAFNAVQYRFGLHYPADEMPMGNAGFLEALKNRGFGAFG